MEFIDLICRYMVILYRDLWTTRLNSANTNFRLYSSTTASDQDALYADFTPVAYTGYAAVDGATATFSNGVDPDGDTETIWDLPVFQAANPLIVSDIISGIYVTLNAGANDMAFFVPFDVPVPITRADQMCKIILRFNASKKLWKADIAVTV